MREWKERFSVNGTREMRLEEKSTKYHGDWGVDGEIAVGDKRYLELMLLV
ncbi:hypothetical protein NLX67_17210 [Domibacillus sp. A3M-37]|nr:hypothetical protein [Domibacillus sp. A3M-37]MCP3764092.1 hypothetical protein [Domibacillus sp. A3M-37]